MTIFSQPLNHEPLRVYSKLHKAVAALFLHATQHQRSSLAADLGARITRNGAV